MTVDTADAGVGEDKTAEKRLERAKRIIRGLMERTEDRGCTEEEALSNAEKVSELLAQYELTMDDVSVKDVSDMVQREVYAADEDAGRLIVGIGKLCSLVVYHKTGKGVTTFVMYGHAPDVELGVYLFEMLSDALDHAWQKDMDKYGYTKKRRVAFRAGFADRVAARMYDLRKERDDAAAARATASGCTSLVVVKDQIVRAEFEKVGPRLVSSKGGSRITDGETFRRGAAAGDTVNLNNPIGDGTKKAGALR